MADMTTYTCNYCGRKFKNEMKAKLHEIEEKIAHNPHPIYTLSISLSLTNLCFDDYLNVNLFKQDTWEENGKQLMYWEWYSTDFDHRFHEFDDSIGKWIFNENYESKEIDDLNAFLKDYLENRFDDNKFEMKIHFKDWNDLGKYLDEFKSALPDKEWIEKYREYFQKVLSKDLKDDICRISDETENALKNSDGKWKDSKSDTFGYGKYEVEKMARKIGLKYGIQEPSDIDFLVWTRRN